MSNEKIPVTVRDNQEAQRYETEVNGQFAFAEYRLKGDLIIFTHTEVPEELEGHGIASQIVRFALDDARARKLSVLPLCPYVAAYIRSHQAYQDLVATEY
jgi:uncharacterized protein